MTDRIRFGKFERGDRIVHNTGKHRGKITTNPYLSSLNEWVYEVTWDDYDRADARHTAEFIEANYQLED